MSYILKSPFPIIFQPEIRYKDNKDKTQHFWIICKNSWDFKNTYVYAYIITYSDISFVPSDIFEEYMKKKKRAVPKSYYTNYLESGDNIFELFIKNSKAELYTGYFKDTTVKREKDSKKMHKIVMSDLSTEDKIKKISKL